MSACVDAGDQWVPGVVGWSSTPLAEGVVMGTFGFARPAKPPENSWQILADRLVARASPTYVPSCSMLKYQPKVDIERVHSW
jgi:hypothetical protein